MCLKYLTVSRQASPLDAHIPMLFGQLLLMQGSAFLSILSNSGMSETSLQHTEMFLSDLAMREASPCVIPLWSHLLWVILHRTNLAAEMAKRCSARISLFGAVTYSLLHYFRVHWLSCKARPMSRKAKSQGYNMIKWKVHRHPVLKGEHY